MDALAAKQSALLCIAIAFITPTSIVNADRTQLLERLKDKTWPWFGDCYKNLCPDPAQNPTYCYNLRPQPESILQRAGIPDNIQLSTDLEVFFSSPKEAVDVCGKTQMMEEVKAFKLPENGHPVQSLLERGAEIYRNRPKVNWNPKENGTYSLIIFDVGLLVLRGAWYDIQYANGLFRGQDDFFYRPPANPLPVVNPILVILMKQEKKLGAFSSLGLGVCSMRIILPYVSICRGKFSKFIGDGSTVVGLQVFYTDGASMFEKYRVCVEGYICDTQCVDKFREYASNKLPQIQFMNLDVSTIDTYVNIRYETKISGPIGIRCCSSITHRAIFGEKRAVPGDDLKVSCYDVLCGSNECHSTMDTEMSSTEKNWKGDNEYSTFYAFVPHLKDGKLEVKFIYLLKNNHINARSRNVTEDKELYYSEGVGTRHMYMLLFTHPNLHKDTPTVSADNKLIFPGDFKLRGMSWILFDHNHLTFMDTECEGNTRTCPPTEEDTPKDFYKINITYTETTYETPTESTTNPVTSCLQKKPPPPPPPPNKASKTLADVNSVVSVCIFLLLLESHVVIHFQFSLS